MSDSQVTAEEFRIMGIVMFLWFWVSLVPYLLILWTFVRRPDFWCNGSYRLLFHVGITDVYSTLDWTTTCCVMVFDWNPIDAALGKNWVSDAIDNISFVPTNTMIMMLAIMRLLVFSKVVLPEWMNEKRLANILAISVYLFSVALFLAHMIPSLQKVVATELENESAVLYIMDLDNRVGCPNYGLTWALGIFVTYYQLVPLLIANLIYLWCLVVIVIKRYKGSGKIMTRQEWRLFYQTTIPCSFKMFTQFTWYFYCASSKVGQMAQLLLLVVDNGYHPWLYLVVNRKLRVYIIKMFISNTIHVSSESPATSTPPRFRFLQLQKNLINHLIRPTTQIQ